MTDDVTLYTPANISIYQIYPRSFMDSNGDGIGDLDGVCQKLSYVRDLGFDAIWISPFFKSPQRDFGYDITDYYAIAPEYGDVEAARRLIQRAHELGLKVLFDLVLNHTSIEHPWFSASRSSRENEHSDWYIWREKPNNWKSMTGGSGWHYEPRRDQWFFASFLPFQPDLNYRNPQVKRAAFDVVRFWLREGVDGFRFDIFNVIFKDVAFRDNPPALKLFPSDSDLSGFGQNFVHTVNLPECSEFARELREVVKEFGERILLGEVFGDDATIARFVGDGTNRLTHVFDFKMLRFRFEARWFLRTLLRAEATFPAPNSPVYVFSNHDRVRSMSRLRGNEVKARLLHFFQLTVRGSPCLYYGEEIGMQGSRLPGVRALDPMARKFPKFFSAAARALGHLVNRDEVRTPMQWTGGRNAGFSSAADTWLPVSDDHVSANVENQSQNETSLLHTVRALLKMRREWPALKDGAVKGTRIKKQVLLFRRELAGQKIQVLINFGVRRTAVRDGDWDQLVLLHVAGQVSRAGNEVILGPLAAAVFAYC